MNNEEKVLKYFADDLSAEEKKKFENEIENSEELKIEFEKTGSMLAQLKQDSKIHADENYFINLVPNVRMKMQNKRELFTIPRLAFSLPVIIVFLVVTFTYKNNDVSFSLNEYKEKLNEAIEKASLDQLEDYIDISYNDYQKSFSAVSFDLEFDDNIPISIGEITLKSFDEYDLINNLSEEEADEIYNKLLNSKIL